jgi:pyruvate,water dikinase
LNLTHEHIPSEIGAKAAGLNFLLTNGFNVPRFFVLPFSFLSTLSEIKEKAIEEIESHLSELEIKNTLFAVRSSASIEDGKEQSFAGQFTTIIGVQTNELANSIWEVLYHFRYQSHAIYSDKTEFTYGIIIQEMITPTFAGVGFSAHPSDADDERVHISVIPGGGEALVSGRFESFLIIQEENSFLFHDLDEHYSGEDLQNKSEIPSVSGHDIAASMKPILEELASGIKKIERLKGHPVDIEFAICKGKIFWLQVRPITTIGAKTIRIWDNSASETNYNGLTLPLTQSFVRRSFKYAYGGLGKKLGIPIENPHVSGHLDRMCDEINGVLYYNVFAWLQLIVQLPFGLKAAQHLPQLWGMESLQFNPKRITTKFQRLRIIVKLVFYLFQNKRLKRNYQNQLLTRLVPLKSSNKRSFDELVVDYTETESALAENWLAPTVNGFFALVFLSVLKKTIHSTPISEKNPNFINDLLQQQSEIITIRMVHDFQEIIRTIQQNEEQLELFTHSEASIIWQEIQKTSSTTLDLIHLYLENYGVKAEDAELKLETVPFKENPVSFIEYITKNLQLSTNRQTEKLDYIKEIKSHYSFLNPKRYWLIFLTKQCIKRMSDRENYRFDRTRVFAHFRTLMHEIENNLVSNNFISKGDIHYLTIEELLSRNFSMYRSIVSQRKTDFAYYKTLTTPVRYKETLNGLEPVELNFLSTDLKGTGCCSGIVRAEVVILNDEELSTNFTSKIVVANFFEPGNIGLFSQAAGLISARGNLLSHTAILCREMGVPSIVGVRNVLNQLKTGDLIEMDGATGTIKKINHE